MVRSSDCLCNCGDKDFTDRLRFGNNGVVFLINIPPTVLLLLTPVSLLLMKVKILLFTFHSQEGKGFRPFKVESVEQEGGKLDVLMFVVDD